MERRRLCKEHAERRLIQEEKATSVRKRGGAITLASVLAVLDGLAGVVVGFLAILIGLLAPTAGVSQYGPSAFSGFLDYFANVTSFPAGETLAVGFVAFSAGSISIAAGYYLCRQSKKAAILSIIMAVFGEALIGSYLVLLALAGAFTFIWVASAIVRIALIAYGWRHLR